jgi:hypothetical protein
MSNYTIVTSPTHNGYSILASPDNPCRSDILNGIDRVFGYALQDYSKVFFVRFDLHYPADGCHLTPDIAINRFRDSFIKNRAREGYRPLYIWCREQEMSPNPHFHFVLLLDGQKTQSIYGHQEKAREMWYKILRVPMPPGRKGLFDPCDEKRPGLAPNGIMIQSSKPNRNNEQNNAFHWASYLAKTKGKGNGGLNTREWGCSQV